MYITTKALADLSEDEYRACSYLNLRGSGLMLYWLMDHKNRSDCHAIMAWNDDRLLGWALLIPHGTGSWHSTEYQRRKSKYIASFYVRKTMRKRGIGGRLMREVKRLDSTPTVIPHDITSADFFASYDVVTNHRRRGMVSAAKRKKPSAA